MEYLIKKVVEYVFLKEVRKLFSEDKLVVKKDSNEKIKLLQLICEGEKEEDLNKRLDSFYELKDSFDKKLSSLGIYDHVIYFQIINYP